jgi:quercetin dioxygenase-like cupin family protein
MCVLTGRERTEEEYAELFPEAGWRYAVSSVETPGYSRGSESITTRASSHRVDTVIDNTWRNKSMKKHLYLTVLVVFILPALTYSSSGIALQQKTAPTPAMASQAHGRMVTPDAVEWRPRSPGLELAVLSGDPAKAGVPFVIRLKLRDGTRVPPHWHPIDEHLTVMTGTLHMGMGEKFEPAGATALPAGSYSLMPKEMRHFVWAEGETILQLHGFGPFKTFWVNPADDPTKKTGSN